MKKIISLAFMILAASIFAVAQMPIEKVKIRKTKPKKIKTAKAESSPACSNIPADMINLILSLTEITASCLAPNSTQNKSCSDGVKVIAVFAVGKDPEGDVLTYNYSVSGGRIIGLRDGVQLDLTGYKVEDGTQNVIFSYKEKVLWDLSGVKPGTYTIEAAVDDGCGFCGERIIKTVVVKECPDCKEK